MKTKKEATEILNILRDFYPEATCSLDFETPFQITIAVMLSAQCTDERVNKTTPLLFKDYGTPEKMANMDIHVLEEIIHPCGFYKNKAKNIKLCAKQVLENFNGIVPDNMDDSKPEYSAHSHRFPPHAMTRILLCGLYFLPE